MPIDANQVKWDEPTINSNEVKWDEPTPEASKVKWDAPEGERPGFEEPPFAARHPTAYGAYGAGKEVAREFSKISYLKYLHPDERQKFTEMDKQHQVRSLLIANLELVTLGRFKALTHDFKRIFPKTYKFLTTPISKLGQKSVAQKIAQHQARMGEHPAPEVVKQWWKEAGAKAPTPKVQTGASKVELMYDEAEVAAQQIGKTTPGQIVGSLKRKFVDVSGNLKSKLLKQGDLGKKAVIQHDLIAGANPKAIQEIEAISGRIFGGLTEAEQTYLNRIIQSRRTIAIENYKKIKHPKKLGATEHQEWLNSLSPELSQKLNQRADTYFSTMRNQLDKLKAEGLINQEAYDALVATGDYSPRQFLQHVDPEITHTFGSQKITTPSSGIKRLAGGSEGLLNNDASALLSQVVARTEARIFRNRANQALYNLAQVEPENGVVQLAKVARKTKDGSIIYQKAPTGHDKISVMIDGAPREMIMPSEFAREWVMRSPEITPQLANMLGWVSGSKVLKPMATGLNPEFALTNMPRDIAHIWLVTQEYSPTLPRAAAQMALDIAKVSKDAILRRGRWTDYINEGGGMEFLTHQGRVTGKLKGTIGEIQKVLGWFGETSEIMTRLALRERALTNGVAADEATWIARNYLDFSQGGSWTKAADTVIPYLNASIQGTRGIVRASIQDPSTFAYKSAQVGLLATGLYLANKNQNPEAWAQISDREKVNNWIITTPFSYKDKDGTKRHIYFKIAKDQGQRVISTVFENLMAKHQGEDVNVDQIAQSVQDAIPIIPTEMLPPSMDAILGYAANKDFWRMEDIWKGPDVSPEAEKTRWTHPAYGTLGEMAGISPERTKYALSQFFTRGNIYTSAAGYAWNQLFEGLPEDEKEKITQEVLNSPFVRRVANETDPYYQYGTDIKDIDRKESTRKYEQNKQLDDVSIQHYDGFIGLDGVKEFIKGEPKGDQRRLWDRHRRMGKIHELPDKRWWLELSGMRNPESKALVFWNRWRTEDDEKQKELERTARQIPNLTGPKFFKKFKDLKQKKLPE